MKYIKLLALLSFLTSYTQAQILTSEDSLNAGLVASDRSTVLSGYGQIKAAYDTKLYTANANLTRNVLFVGHKFNNKVSLFSELEIEDAKVVGGQSSGEISMEQLLLKFYLNKNNYLIGGLFIPRLGIINENHLPTTFNGNDRPFVETLVIPSTWREIGVGLFGNFPSLPSLNYTLSLTNGLNASGFESGSGIREGRFEGSNATASNLAISGSLLWYVNNFRLQASGYYGGSVGLSPKQADSLQLTSGAFGTPVILAEANVQYSHNGLTLKALTATINIANASDINRAYANNTAKNMYGAYAEIGYNILHRIKNSEKNLTFFGRVETIDLNQNIPENGITNDALIQQYVIVGTTYFPTRGVAVKLDYVFRQTGTPNDALVVNPFPQAQTYHTQKGFINIGLGYSF